MMALTAHPIQRAGAHAAAVLAGKPHPADITGRDLTSLVTRIVDGAAKAAMAAKGSPGWAWQARIAICFPNSPATHLRRFQWGDSGVRSRLEAIFGGDESPQGPCFLCGRPGGQRWGRSLMPLADSGAYLNTQPAGGHPYCLPCRIAAWCAPYGSGHQFGRMRTVSAGDEGLERRVAALNVAIALEVAGENEPRWRELGDTVIAAGPGEMEVTEWVNANRECSAATVYLSRRNARVLARAHTDPQAWSALASVAGGQHPFDYLLADARHDAGKRLMHAVAAESGRAIQRTGNLPAAGLLTLARIWTETEANA